jgi:AcrR family transcriptional regulator
MARRLHKNSDRPAQPLPTAPYAYAENDAVIQLLERAAERGEITAEVASDAIRRLKQPVKTEAHDRSAPPNSGERRAHILRVAARVFSQKGYSRASLQEIADEIGVTRPSFYYHFNSKQQILEAICDAAMVRAEESLDEVLALDLPPKQRLRLVLTRYFEVVTSGDEVPVLFRTMHELSPEFGQAMRRRRDAFDKKVAAIVDEGVAAGELRSRNSRITAYGLLGAQNWVHTWYRPTGPLSRAEIAENLCDLLMDGVSAS